MAAIRIAAIIPRRAFVGNPRAAQDAAAALVKWQGGIVKDMRIYPVQQPPWGGSQSLGKRVGGRTAKRTWVGRKPYRRTGTLGRNWVPRISRYDVTVSNRTPYAGYVQGFTTGPKGQRQTAVMASKNWQSLSTVAVRHNRVLKADLRRALGKGF